MFKDSLVNFTIILNKEKFHSFNQIQEKHIGIICENVYRCIKSADGRYIQTRIPSLSCPSSSSNNDITIYSAEMIAKILALQWSEDIRPLRNVKMP